MKASLLPFVGLLTACGLSAADPSSPAPSYVDEAPLPEAWPKPGPYNEVTKKNYPAYRAAFTRGRGETSSFWRLFRHIKKNDIPMTAPVEMSMEPKDGSLDASGMAFLYQNDRVGTTGQNGKNIEVRDVAATEALSYAWQGTDSKANIDAAKDALKAEIEARGITTEAFRLLGYNGPGTPRNQRTWELQAVIK